MPNKKYYQFSNTTKFEVKNDSLFIYVDNPLKCPLTIKVFTKNKEVKSQLNVNFPLVLKSEKDSLLFYSLIDVRDKKLNIKFSSIFGTPNDEINIRKVSLPFFSGRKYKVIQGYNGRFSHQEIFSKYAIDFNLKKGDTICAVADGYVVGVIEDYKYGGKSKEWRPYANFVTVYHPEMNIYSQYVHLKYKGSLVSINDAVKMNQAIALSGDTGFSSGEHLHFNAFKATHEKPGWESIKIDFTEGYKGKDLSKGVFVRKKI